LIFDANKAEAIRLRNITPRPSLRWRVSIARRLSKGAA